ncbi:MAG: hypothetical protein ACQET7_06805 [Thermodesulfobacteriota bacterium]
MKKLFLFSMITAAFFLGLIPAPAAPSGLQVQLDVQEVAKHSVLVTLSWTVTIQADRDWESCELLILFRDDQEREIHRINKMLSVKKGRNEVTGHDICETSVWDRTRKFSGKLNCGF